MRDNNNIIAPFIATATAYPKRIALIQGDESMSYGRLMREARQSADLYLKKGIQRGDKVLVFVPMGIELYRIVLGLFYIGACPVFLDEWVNTDRLKECCKVVHCKGIIADFKFLLLSRFVKELKNIKVRIKTNDISFERSTLKPAEVDSSDTALVTFTTGTTGIPKAADRTHNFLYEQYEALKPMLENDADISLVLLPIVVLINFGLGKTTVLPRIGFSAKDEDAASSLIGQMLACHVEEYIGSPAITDKISRLLVNSTVKPGLKNMIIGGGPVFPDIAQNISKIYAPINKLVVYGSTEAEPISSIPISQLVDVTDDDILRSGLPVGKLQTGIRLAVIPYTDNVIGKQTTASWESMQLPAGKVGEIVVTGTYVLQHYINNDEAERRHKIIVDKEIWHRTGDAGRMDENGNLFLYGLCREMIDWHGRVIYPVLAAYSVKTLLNVSNAALLDYNDKLVLFIESENKTSADTAKGRLGNILPQDTVVKQIKSIPTDPRHNTKIDYAELRKALK